MRPDPDDTARALRTVRTVLVVSAAIAAYTVTGWLLAEHFTR
ncbi:hypothetical protein AB0O07_32250 [Streptomyces sp. NPDC093085]